MKDRVAACNIIPVLVHCENERAYEDTFLHSLISFLIAMSDEFAHDDFCCVVFDDFLLVSTLTDQSIFTGHYIAVVLNVIIQLCFVNTNFVLLSQLINFYSCYFYINFFYPTMTPCIFIPHIVTCGGYIVCDPSLILFLSLIL